MNKYIKSVLTSATLVIAALTFSTTTNAASIRKLVPAPFTAELPVLIPMPKR